MIKIQNKAYADLKFVGIPVAKRYQINNETGEIMYDIEPTYFDSLKLLILTTPAENYTIGETDAMLKIVSKIKALEVEKELEGEGDKKIKISYVPSEAVLELTEEEHRNLCTLTIEKIKVQVVSEAWNEFKKYFLGAK